MLMWIEALRADAVFGWRQIRKHKVASAAAVLSLGLGIGACASAFRLIDALLLRPLPVAEPGRLYALFRQGFGGDSLPRKGESFEYPLFRDLRDAVKDQAGLIAASYADRVDITYKSDQEMERVHRQYISGSMFPTFGLQPAAGRLFTEKDDRNPGAHPYAVLSHDYWTRRFARDPKAVGGTFRMAGQIYQIIGVSDPRFTGTEPGTVIDIFIPAMMHPGVLRSDWSWFRTLVYINAGAKPGPILERLHAPFRAFQQERARGFVGLPKEWIERFLKDELLLEPAPSGISNMQKDHQRSLLALAVLVALVLLIACANVANLMMAQASARAREMALRVSIGAGRWRLTQLVLVESAWLAFLAAAVGAAFSWWSAPFVVSRINPPDNPARLLLPIDWRVLAFSLILAVAVTFLFGLGPALRASAVKPASALKGGEDPHARRRLMHGLIAAQVAFCFLVVFVAGMFVASFHRISHQSTGFSSERILTLDAVASKPQPAALWDQVMQRLQSIPGVETVALSSWALLDGNGWNGLIAVDGRPPSAVLSYFLSISPGWVDTMKIPFLDGRDLHPADKFPGSAIVNQAFARQYFGGQNPVGRWFEKAQGGRFQIVGLVGDARYRNMREPLTPTAYVSFPAVRDRGTFIVRTSIAAPGALAQTLRQEIPRARPEFRVSNVRTQTELNAAHTVRERLLSMLAQFFAFVALLLAGIGLYGVLDYSVLQRRREIGIRMAIGAPSVDIARRVTIDIFSMVLVGSLAGLAMGLAAERYIETLLYGVKATGPAILAIPSLMILTAALLAASAPVIRALRIDPARILRSE